MRVAPLPPELSGKANSVGAFAGAGYWYDALATLRGDIAKRPKDAALLATQQALLEQVGLTEVARHERERALGN